MLFQWKRNKTIYYISYYNTMGLSTQGNIVDNSLVEPSFLSRQFPGRYILQFPMISRSFVSKEFVFVKSIYNTSRCNTYITTYNTHSTNPLWRIIRIPLKSPTPTPPPKETGHDLLCRTVQSSFACLARVYTHDDVPPHHPLRVRSA